MGIFTVKGENYTIFDKMFNTADYIIAKNSRFPICETQEEALTYCRDLCSSMQNCSEEFKEARALEFARHNYPLLFKKDAEVENYPTEDSETNIQKMAENLNEQTAKAIKEILDKPITPVEKKEEAKKENTSSEKPAKVEKKDSKKVSSDKVENENASTDDTNMAKVDLGLGIAFDPDAINKAFEEEAMVHAQTVNPWVVQPQPFVAPPASAMFNPQMMQQPQMPVQPPMMPQQIMPNIAGWPTMVPQQPQMPIQPPMMPQPPMAPPIHKVDEPPKPVAKPQAPQTDGVEVDLKKVNIDGLMAPPTVVQPPEFIQKLPPVPAQQAPAAKEPIKENIADNREIIAKFPKIPLAEIEAIANQNGCNVAFQESPAPGIISVITFEPVNGKNMTINPKCFCIDTGMIIDKRLKLIDVCPLVANPNSVIPLECGEFYELRTVNIKDHNRKVLDRQLINDIFYAGTASITKKPMYSTAFKDLNKMVSLISIPTRNINAEQRNSIQNFLLNKLMGEGYLEKAISMAPGSRFEFVTSKLDKDNLGTFTLTNEGVPAFYGAGQLPVNPIIIEVTNGDVSIRSNGDKPDGMNQNAAYMQPGNPPVIDACTDPNCACHG